MKSLILVVSIFFSLNLVGQGSEAYLKKLLAYQDTLNMEFSDPTTTPLDSADLQSFKGLAFFPIDEKYRVMAEFIRTPKPKPFGMKTTTERRPVYQKYADVIFELNGQEHKLTVYQGLDIIKKEEYKDYLFLPFLDETNGMETYGGGRYISLYIPDGDSIEIDFNQAYNPYCVYSDRYSCPIVPRSNRLRTKVNAGVKKFKDY